jgi:hypothetical protein
MEPQVRRIIQNTREQRLVGYAYLALGVSLHLRPDVGSILPYVESTTFLTPYTIAAVYFLCAGFLLRSVNIMLWKYTAAIMPILATCLYLFVYMVGNVQSSLLSGIIGFLAAALLLNDLQKQAVNRG